MLEKESASWRRMKASICESGGEQERQIYFAVKSSVKAKLCQPWENGISNNVAPPLYATLTTSLSQSLFLGSVRIRVVDDRASLQRELVRGVVCALEEDELVLVGVVQGTRGVEMHAEVQGLDAGGAGVGAGVGGGEEYGAAEASLDVQGEGRGRRWRSR